MPGLAVIVAILHENQILLTQREDKELYELRDRSKLTRQQFYLKRFEQIEIIEKVEVGNV